MNKLLIAGVCGLVAALISVADVYEWQMQIDVYAQVYILGVVMFVAGALANVGYWYGFSIIGTMYRNGTLHLMALVALALSIIADASNVLFVLLPQYAASPAWDAASFFTGTVQAIAFIVTGLALQRLRHQLGDTAHWYGMFLMLAGALILGGDFGSSYITLFAMASNAVLYVLGSTLLFQAAKK